MKPHAGDDQGKNNGDIATKLVVQSQILVMLSIVAELARRMQFPGLVARCSPYSFDVETRDCIGRLLLRIGEEQPQLVNEVYARLNEMQMAPDDPHGRFSQDSLTKNHRAS